MKKLTLLFFSIMMTLLSWQGNAQSYCASGAGDSSFEHITNVTFAGINNTTGGQSGYNDFTAQKANITQGETYQISVSIVADGNDYLDVFIDWDHSGWTLGVPIPASQVYRIVGPTSEDGTYTMNVTVPIDAVLGDTRMRVKLGWGHVDVIACDTFLYGEVEDYTVNVTAASICEDPTNLAASNITNSKADLSWTAGDGQTDWVVIYGEADFDPLNHGITVPVNTNPETTIVNLSPDTEYDFYVKAICGLEESDLVGPESFTTEPSTPAVELNSAGDFGILAGTGITSAGASIISNTNVGVSPGGRGTITGDIVVVNGAIYAADDANPPGVPAMLLQAKSDLEVAYNFAAGASAPAPATVDGDLGGRTLYPGIYKSATTLLIQQGDLTLDAQGDPDARWIFQIGTGLTTISGAGGNVILTGGAQAKNITWQVGSSATIATSFKGNILAYTSITMDVGSTTDGRLLAMHGLVALSGSITIDQPCRVPTNLTVSNITGYSADISWTEGSDETEWEVSYGPANFDPHGTAGTTVSVSIDSETTLNDLDISTDYDVYVRAICDVTNEIEWAGPVSFNTSSCGFATVPYLLDFESAIVPNLPECTSIENNGIGNDWKTSSVLLGILGNVLNYSAHSADGPANSWFYTQGIELLAGVEYQISYTYASVGLFNTESMKVAYGMSPNEVAMTNQLADYPSITQIVPRVETLSFTIAADGVYYFGFNAYSEANQNQLYVDDIGITIAPITGYVYDNGWLAPKGDPNVNTSTDQDNITIINGDASFTTNIEANNLIVRSGATLEIEKVLYVSGDVTNIGEIIFLSTATGDGELGEVPEGSNFAGSGIVTMHLYMSSNRAYRMVSSSVKTSTSIHDNWQEGATSNTDNPASGFGTHITGTTVDQTNGLDATGTGNPSMFYVPNGTQEFAAVTNTDVNTLVAGEPYLLYVRGDRSIDLTNNDSRGETILRASGSLAHGINAQSFDTNVAGEFIMFGNPYQSAVDINSVFENSTNVNTNQYMVYDPTLADVGAYVTVTLSELDGTGENTAGSEANQFLQVGQGAQVATVQTGQSVVVFHQADKRPGEFTRTNATGNQLSAANMLTVQLYTTDRFNNGGPVHDSFGMIFDESYTNELTPTDAVKPMNFFENFGINHDGTYLSIERREMPQAEEVYPLYSAGYQHSEYTLKMMVDGLDTTFLYLDDNFTGTSTLLETGETAYGFTIDANAPLSKASDRFSIRTEARLGVDDNNLLSGIRLFPNPMNDNIFYLSAPKLNGETIAISINDVLGREVFNGQQTFSGNSVKVELSQELQSGVYLVTVSSYGESQTLRVIKR